MDFAILTDHRVKINESEKRAKNLNLARERKTQKKMEMMVIPVVNDVPCTIPKGLVKLLEDFEIREEMKTTQNTQLLRLARILRRAMEI